MSALQITNLQSPFGHLIIKANENALVEINLNASKVDYDFAPFPLSGVLAKTCDQLHEYFAGERKEFSIPCEQNGSDFQKRVWAALQKIPYGETASYIDIAVICGNAGTVRVVGGANSINKIPIIVPCHRVIGKNGKLVGYSGGIATKIWLLEHERRNSEYQQLLLF